MRSSSVRILTSAWGTNGSITKWRSFPVARPTFKIEEMGLTRCPAVAIGRKSQWRGTMRDFSLEHPCWCAAQSIAGPLPGWHSPWWVPACRDAWSADQVWPLVSPFAAKVLSRWAPPTRCSRRRRPSDISRSRDPWGRPDGRWWAFCPWLPKWLEPTWCAVRAAPICTVATKKPRGKGEGLNTIDRWWPTDLPLPRQRVQWGPFVLPRRFFRHPEGWHRRSQIPNTNAQIKKNYEESTQARTLVTSSSEFFHFDER